jgi:LPPG:FO 2-phospho-L-lactate transferase
MTARTEQPAITLLAGGVGAARLLRGLTPLVDPDRLTVVVNTGDDEEFYGLHVSPDLDTIVYTLAGLAPRARGWGIRGDGHRVLGALERFYGPAWFALGDRDLATHVFRTDRLRGGASLSECTAEICRALSVESTVLPATDDRVRTVLHTDEGELPFQTYLVKERARPAVREVRYDGADAARAAPGVVDAISGADLVLIAPSNPFVSIGPMLAVAEIRAALRGAADRTVAVSPLIGGRAVKGPLAAMLFGMGMESSARSISALYRELASTLVVAPGDAAEAGSGDGPRPVEHDILLDRPAAARRLGRFLLELAATHRDGQASGLS